MLRRIAIVIAASVTFGILSAPTDGLASAHQFTFIALHFPATDQFLAFGLNFV